MRILVINADCLLVNTSANLCHLAYLTGLVEAGYQVDLLSADSHLRRVDHNMIIPQEINSITYPGLSFYEWMSIKMRNNANVSVTPASEGRAGQAKLRGISKIISLAKRAALSLYGVHGIYSTFVRKAKAFRESEEYDYVLSISTPTASHLLAHNLLESGHVKARHWIQIWEDPWYSDAYGLNSNKAIYREEARLLRMAEWVCYVSPLTLKKQKEIYPESAEKMYWQPLPAYYSATMLGKQVPNNSYGYFGDYTPEARDLTPFYQAAKRTGITVNICGNPSDLFASTDRIKIHPRLPLQKLKPIEDKTNALVFLCNRQGGQIPGKIYQYSATDKIILFILDGTEEEQKVLMDYFGQFNRYVFCQNTVEDIARAIRDIERGELHGAVNQPLTCFGSKKIVRKILAGIEE